ncbi:pentatricopeptide repeat-containing protein At5g39710 [Silene latifolia]|uniref:pentatricopeptide repeat-containing protein At5g39710 n=1 Tax=Silene latifolia TaxID=37657 RepID=UPI003D77F797
MIKNGDVIANEVAEKAMTYLRRHPQQLSSLLPKFSSEAGCMLLLKSQSDASLTLKFINWARSHPFFDARCKVYALHILTRFHLFKTALPLAQDLAVQSHHHDPSGQLVFQHLHSSYQLFHPASTSTSTSSSVIDLMVKSYSSLQFIDKALLTLRLAIHHGFMPGILSYNSLLHAITLRTPTPFQLLLAQSLYHDMTTRLAISPNVFTFNILIRAFCASGDLRRALGFFSHMRRIGCLPNLVSCNTLLNALFRLGRPDDTINLFRFIKSNCLQPNLITYNTLINGLCREGSINQATEVLDDMTHHGLQPDEVTFNTLVHAHCKLGNFHQALVLHSQMMTSGLSPDVITYTSLINNMCKDGNLSRAMDFLDQMRTRGLRPNEVTYTTLIDGFSQQGLLNEAYRLLKEMTDSGFSPSLVTYNALIKGHCVMGKMEEAMHLIQDMTERGLVPDVVSYSTIISGFCRSLELDRAFQMKQEMVARGISPDVITYSSLIKGLCQQNKVTDACGLFEEMLRLALPPDEVTYTTLINAYCQQGNIRQAFHLHDEMIQNGLLPDVVTYSVLINGLNKQSRTKEAKRLLFKMFYEDSVPAGVTYDTLIESCGNSEFSNAAALLKGFCVKGLMNEADRVFESLLQRGQKATEAVYNVLVHGHSKWGNTSKAYDLYKEMVHSGFIPHTVTILALIKSLSKEEMNMELGDVLENVLRSCKLTDAELAKVLVEVNHKAGNMEEVLNILSDMASSGLLPSSGTGAGYAQ